MTIDIDSWTQQEKQEVLRTLVKQAVGPASIELVKSNAFVAFNEDLRPGEISTLQSLVHERFTPQKLIIFESVSEKIEFEETTEFQTSTTGKLWWKKSSLVPQRSRRYEHKKEFKIAPTSWAVHGIFAGNRCLIPTYSVVSGGAFVSDGSISFVEHICESSLYLTLQVKNLSNVTLPFSAVILGQRAPEVSP